MSDVIDLIGNATLDPSLTVTVNTRSFAVAAADTECAPKIPLNGAKTSAPAMAHTPAMRDRDHRLVPGFSLQRVRFERRSVKNSTAMDSTN